MATSSSQRLDQSALATALPGVYVVPLTALDPDARVHFIDGRAVLAVAPHPFDDELVYVTTAHSEALAFLPDGYLELDV